MPELVGDGAVRGDGQTKTSSGCNGNRHKSKSFQMISMELAVKRPPAHADFLRRARAVAVRFFQGAHHQLFLNLLHGQIILL